jgi:sulfate adenylyltransferase
MQSPADRLGPSAAEANARVSLEVAADVLDQAVAAGRLIVADAESLPVVALDEIRAESPTVVSGLPTALGESRRVDPGLRSTGATPSAAGPASVVVLDRPLLNADEAALAGHPNLVLAVPVAGPSVDGIPAAAMLRMAQASASRLGARVLAVTIDWRDPDSDSALARHVAAGLAAQLVTLPADRTWVTVRDTVLAGRPTSASEPPAPTQPPSPTDLQSPAGPPPRTEPLSAHAPDSVVVELLRWRPPRHRRGLVVFFTGLSGAGKSTLARMLSDHLLATGERSITVLDGDHVRRLLSAGLGFGPAGRDQNVRRIGFVAAEVARHGGVAICAPIAPYEQSRTAARRMVEQVGDFVLVHVATSLADCEARDVKGLYARARAGELSEFTGISDPYEVPADAELRIETAGRTPSESLEQVLSYLRTGGWLTEPAE